MLDGSAVAIPLLVWGVEVIFVAQVLVWAEMLQRSVYNSLSISPILGNSHEFQCSRDTSLKKSFWSVRTEL